MANYYIGEEAKFTFEAKGTGFSMNSDDFDVEVSAGGATVSAQKRGSTTRVSTEDLSIFKENSQWYFIVNTTKLAEGPLILSVTAYIPDANAFDGIRTEIISQRIGNLYHK